MPPDEQPSRQINLLKIPASPSLKFGIIAPFFILIALLILALTGSTLITGQISLQTMAIGMMAFLAVIALGLLIARQISRRLEEVVKAAERIAEGDFSIRINDPRQDEIGRLVQAFNQMAANLDELHHSRELLSRTMSPAVRQSLIERGLDFRGMIQVVSILFIDVQDFTRITEICHPEQVVFFLNDYYTSIANQVHSSGGIIGKYGGDSMLAFFGAPNPEEQAQSSTNALLTALALQDTIDELSQRWTVLGLPPIHVGMGLSIGPGVAGPIGSEQQFEYTVIGDAVNLAARLQTLTRNISGYNIILSAEVYEALDTRIKDQIQIIGMDDYEILSQAEKARRPALCVDLGEVLVKGKKGPIHVYGIPDMRGSL